MPRSEAGSSALDREARGTGASLASVRTNVPIAALAAALALPAGIVGCGSERAAGGSASRVALTIAAPADGARVGEENVEVRGRVAPAAADVSVLGRPALVTRGEFTVVVPLQEGANVVDVVASARGRAPALTAIRITREDQVSVPDLADLPARDLEATLAPLDLTAEAQRGGGVLDGLVPRALRVCDQDPQAGAKVRRGSVVRVVVARSC